MRVINTHHNTETIVIIFELNGWWMRIIIRYVDASFYRILSIVFIVLVLLLTSMTLLYSISIQNEPENNLFNCSN